MNYHGYTQVISQQLPLSPGLHSQEVMTLEREQLCVTAVYAVKQMPDELNATPSLPGAIFFCDWRGSHFLLPPNPNALSDLEKEKQQSSLDFSLKNMNYYIHFFLGGGCVCSLYITS